MATLGVLTQVLAEMEIAVEEWREASGVGHRIASRNYEIIVVDQPDAEATSQLVRQARQSGVNANSLIIGIVDAQTAVRGLFAAGANFVLYRPVIGDRARASLRAASHLIRREKRHHPRAQVHTQANISYPDVENATATLIDLSEEGLAIQCERRLPAKSKIYFRFTLPGQMKWIQLSGDTVWQDSTGRVGIRFVDVPQTARRLLKEWLNSRISVQDSKVTIQLPLRAPGRLANSPPDRRIQSRHACHLGAEVYRAGTSVPNHCGLTDISMGGCYVEMPSPFATGTAVELVVRTHNFKFRSRGTVQVVHQGFGMGVAFAAQTDEQREQVQELIRLVFQSKEAAEDSPIRF
ncbi:MAG TPA: PilZ domain-containing protein [Terriglobales bacterium]